MVDLTTISGSVYQTLRLRECGNGWTTHWLIKRTHAHARAHTHTDQLNKIDLYLFLKHLSDSQDIDGYLNVN